MKVTINQKTNDSIYKGEDKDFTLYFYDSTSFEPVDLSAYDEIIVCFRNTDNTVLDITTTLTSLTGGKIDFSITSSQSALLATQKNSLQVEFNDTVGSTSNIEVFSIT